MPRQLCAKWAHLDNTRGNSGSWKQLQRGKQQQPGFKLHSYELMPFYPVLWCQYRFRKTSRSIWEFCSNAQLARQWSFVWEKSIKKAIIVFWVFFFCTGDFIYNKNPFLQPFTLWKGSYCLWRWPHDEWQLASTFQQSLEHPSRRETLKACCVLICVVLILSLCSFYEELHDIQVIV